MLYYPFIPLTLLKGCILQLGQDMHQRNNNTNNNSNYR